MNTDNLLRDALELLFVCAVGGTLFSAVRRLKNGEIQANICGACGRPTSRAYPRCTKCGAAQEPSTGEIAADSEVKR